VRRGAVKGVVQGQMPSIFRSSLVVADFDRNGSPDLLEPEAGNLAILRNIRGSPPLLAQFTLNPAVAQSGVTVAQGTVWLGSAAPASGAMVTLRNCYEITLPLRNVLGYSGVDG
jgi:hypothetical protein